MVGLKFDDSLLDTEPRASRVPPGVYKLAIRSVKSDIKSWPDDVRLVWTFTIRDGVVPHGTLKMTTTLKKDAQFSFGRLLEATGFDSATRLHGKEVKDEATFEPRVRGVMEKELVGKEIAALVADSRPDDRNRVYSNVQEIYTVTEYEEHAAAVNTAPRPTTFTASDDGIEDLGELAKEIEDGW
mgnify:CR=1 FL=1